MSGPGPSHALLLPTPLVAVDLGLGRPTHLKLETSLPTGSHKDREAFAIVEAAVASGATGVGCASTGNLAVSLAFAAWRTGVACHLWLHRPPSAVMEVYLRSFGATVHPFEGTLAEAYRHSSAQMAELGIVDANPGRSPHKLLANEHIAREILEQRPSVTDVVCCVNNGSHLLGLAMGLRGHDVRLTGITTSVALAGSIAGYCAAEGADRVDAAIQASGGTLIDVDEAELRAGVARLLRLGLLTEPTGGAVVAALDRMPIAERADLVLVVSGSALKKPDEVATLFADGSGPGAE